MNKGVIQFLFKGMFMQTEKASVVDSTSNCSIIVKREDDGQLFEFVKFKKDWILKHHISSNSLLCGTCFVFDT
jgi:hypothetical protein